MKELIIKLVVTPLAKYGLKIRARRSKSASMDFLIWEAYERGIQKDGRYHLWNLTEAEVVNLRKYSK